VRRRQPQGPVQGVRHRVARQYGRVGLLGLRPGDLDAVVGPVGQLGRAGHAGSAARDLLGVVEGGARDPEVDHGEHLCGVGERGVAVQRLVDGRGAAADEGPLLGDLDVPHDQVEAAGPDHADDVPVLDDLDLVGPQQDGAGLAARRLVSRDPDPEHVGRHAAAGPLPPAVHQEAGPGVLGGLHREQAAREDDVRAVRVELRLGLERERREVDQR
jgi:hypothetical protein